MTLARILNLMFDGLLVKQQIVCNRDFSSVHSLMDEYYTLCHQQNREVNPDVNEITELILSRTDETEAMILNDYLRVALGHIVLASLSDGFAFDNEYLLTKMAYQLYLDRDYCNCSVNKVTCVVVNKTVV